MEKGIDRQTGGQTETDRGSGEGNRQTDRLMETETDRGSGEGNRQTDRLMETQRQTEAEEIRIDRRTG